MLKQFYIKTFGILSVRKKKSDKWEMPKHTVAKILFKVDCREKDGGFYIQYTHIECMRYNRYNTTVDCRL